MVLQKRLDYGFNGYRVPAMPRATRSKLARRDSSRRKTQDNHHYAFDLLATVAGRLLLERESFPTAGKSSLVKDGCEMDTNSLKKEQKDENSPPKGECYEELEPQVHNQSSTLKESTCAHNSAFSGLASVIITPPDCTERVGSAKNLVTGKNKFEIGSHVKREKVGFSEFGLSGYPKFEHERKSSTKLELQVLADSGTDQYSVEYPVVSNGKSPARVSSSNSSAKVSLCRNHIPCGPFPAAVKLGSSIRDDDENSSGCTHPSTLKKAYKPPSPITDHRVRKLLALKYRKLPSTKDGELSNVDGDLKRIYCNNRKAFYKRQKTRRNYPFKKRKFHECRSVSGSGRGTSGEGNHYSSRKGINGDASGHHAKMLGVNGTASSRGGQHTFFKSRDSHVKLRIKSFRVPELFVDIPETATVGSLKRNVMDAVTAILGGGVRIGVVLQGKKVKDDNKTLLQTGISHDNHSDALHFILEPKASQAPTSPSPNGHPSLNSCDKSQSSSKYPPTTGGSHQPVFDVCPDLPVTSLGNFIESDHDSAPSPTDTSTENSAADSHALVAIPATGVEALTVVPAPPKSKQSEIMPRRIRRPFSVSEVEALVQAVETLGTGRWRDVKRRAFDYASHRTYVDLKDKWKTLVHTAKISPGQRRGEPVPQQLLDRVLAAHAYWSHSQQQHKHK